MSTRVDPDLSKKLDEYGLFDNNTCFNCGHCTATCSLTEGHSVFPRKEIKYVQLGLKDKLHASVEPWLCYYCGDCTTHCPREANPAEQMMSFRRYLTSVYDWTGLSAKFYTSKAWEFGAIAFFFFLIIALFVIFHMAYPGHFNTGLFVAEDGSPYVPLNTFAPVEWIHLGDMIMAGILTFLLVSNVFNMYLKIIRSEKGLKIPFYLYFTKFKELVIHFFSQRRLLTCDDRKPFWRMHFFLVSGYILMFSMIVFLLHKFQIDKEGINWTTWVGYYCTIVLMWGCIYAMLGRLKKTDEIHKHSHFSDWMFLILLFLTVLTGIAVHIARYYLQLPITTYVLYVLHLAILVPMLMVEVPFSKWAHLAYRPVAMYLSEIKEEARAIQAAKA